MKTLHCRDAGFDCEEIIHADTEKEILNQAARHALEVHGVTVTSEMADQISMKIRDENEEEE